jgi:hypothetical protein
MSGFDDDACIDEGLCSDFLPQYFELVDGTVRVKSERDDAGGERAAPGATTQG